MSFWAVLKNIGTIMDTFKVISGIIRAIAGRDVKMPSCEEAKMLIKQLRKLLDSGVIDVPGIEEKDVSQILGQIEDRLVCTIDNADKELKKLVASGIDLKGRNL